WMRMEGDCQRMDSATFSWWRFIAGAVFILIVDAPSYGDQDSIISLIGSAKNKVRFCDASIERTECEKLASAISANSIVPQSPMSVVRGREESAFQTLGKDCPTKGEGSITGLPL